jgi:ubiquinone/menaquinone biosynthesis C-methylase UbiE
MTKKQEENLFTMAFGNLPPSKKNELLAEMYRVLDNKENLINYVTNEKLKLRDQENVHEGDYVYLELNNISTWPAVNKEYYEQNNKLIDEKYIKVLMNKISIVDFYIFVDIETVQGLQEARIAEYSIVAINKLEDIF